MADPQLDDPAVRRSDVVRRLKQVREILERLGGAGALLSTRRDFAWLTAGGSNHVVLASESGVAAFLVVPHEAVVITTGIEAARIAHEELTGLPVGIESVPWYEQDAIRRAAERRVDAERLLDDEALEEDLRPLRSRLSELDQARMSWLGARAGAALRAALDGSSAGDTEEAVATVAVAELSRRGIRSPVVLAAADDRIDRYRHPLPGPTAIRRRLMLVLVAERWGLHAAVTRFREFEPPDEQLVRRIAATREIERAMHDATIPGRTLGDVFVAAQSAYARAGFPDEWQLHHQGGAIAYQGRERIATPGDPTLIEPGMAFAWNPSITGAKAEDTFILGPDAQRRIVTSSADEPAG